MKFRKKPVVIEAEQFFPDKHPWPIGVEVGTRTNLVINNGKPFLFHFIRTLEGNMGCSSGDWIITGVKGERYPCKPDIFEASYEPVD